MRQRKTATEAQRVKAFFCVCQTGVEFYGRAVKFHVCCASSSENLFLGLVLENEDCDGP